VTPSEFFELDYGCFSTIWSLHATLNEAVLDVGGLLRTTGLHQQSGERSDVEELHAMTNEPEGYRALR